VCCPVGTVCNSDSDITSKNKSTLEVADIFRAYGDAYRRKHPVSYAQLKVINAIRQCRTAALGGHMSVCDACGVTDISYNSCRNRHCPKCQTLSKLRWVKQRQSELLPVPYFHVVFTLPHELNPLIRSNAAMLYDLLFKAASKTLLAFGQDPKRLGGELGATMVLHTWGQNLSLHPHVHCIVPGGALTQDNRWSPAKSNYLFPARAMAKHFQANYLKRLKEYYEQRVLEFHGEAKIYSQTAHFNQLKESLWKKKWVVYAKKNFAGPDQIIQYLSNYTHRIAISNHRLISLEKGHVSFHWRDYADNNKTKKVMSLTVDEFMRRYLLHVLPPRFTRIRQVGFLANRCKAAKLECCRKALMHEPEQVEAESVEQIMLRVFNIDIHLCQHCQKGNKKIILILPSRYNRARKPDT